MKFFNLKTKESMEVADDQVSVVTMKNGRKAGTTEVDVAGKKMKLFKILGKDDATRLQALGKM